MSVIFGLHWPRLRQVKESSSLHCCARKLGSHILRPVYTERLRSRHLLTLMMDANVFYIEIYRKTQTPLFDVNRPLHSMALYIVNDNL